MNRHTFHPALALVALLAAGPADAAEENTIKDFLFAHNAGPVAANDIIRVNKSVIADLQTPRDLALSLGSFGDRDTEKGFGLSFTPGRSGFDAVAVSASKYGEGSLVRRIWGGTTFSYAQNRTSGAAEYDQSALAVSTTFVLHHGDDPIVVAYKALATSEGGVVQCPVEQEGLKAAATQGELEERRLVEEFTQANSRTPDRDELQAIQRQAEAFRLAEIEALAALRNCAHKVAAVVESKWNASRAQLMFGRGWTRPVSGAGPRVRLATHAKLSIGYGVGADGLVNLTVRRVADDLDPATLGGTPAYTSTNSAAVRYTYRASKKGDMFALAEVSNVKESKNAASQADFKQALGLDKKVGPGLWLEFRYGRARRTDGSGLENKALFTLKFSEDTSLDKETR